MRSLVILLALLVAAPAAAASDPDSTRVARPSYGVAPLSQGLLLSNYFAKRTVDAGAPAYLTLSLNPFTPPNYAPTSFFEAALFGAGTAGTLAMFVGAIGNTLGAFDEDTTWIMTGAAAAAGALYSTTHFKLNASLGKDEWTPRPPSDR